MMGRRRLQLETSRGADVPIRGWKEIVEVVLIQLRLSPRLP